MTIHVNPEPLQILEHREQLLRERLRQVNAKQYDLLIQEREIRSDLDRVANDRLNLLGQSGSCR